jgi:uncharacterized protein (TIGR00255 family)
MSKSSFAPTSSPISGMTGFGRSEGVVGDVAWVWEARSVNGRNLDVKFRTPPGMEALEPRIREACANRFKRGSVQISLSAKKETASLVPKLQINQDILNFYIQAGRHFVEAGTVKKPTWDGLLALRGVVETSDVIEADDVKTTREAAIIAGLDIALDRLQDARRTEGEALYKLFSDIFDKIALVSKAAQAAAEDQVRAIGDRVQKRAAELLGDTPYDEQRLLQEAAALALKADVREELDRLASHVEEARKLLTGGGDIGRKLEFLAQEFHRESNTLTAKAAAMPLTRAGLELKATVDQLKEQAANVE